MPLLFTNQFLFVLLRNYHPWDWWQGDQPFFVVAFPVICMALLFLRGIYWFITGRAEEKRRELKRKEYVRKQKRYSTKSAEMEASGLWHPDTIETQKRFEEDQKARNDKLSAFRKTMDGRYRLRDGGSNAGEKSGDKSK